MTRSKFTFPFLLSALTMSVLARTAAPQAPSTRAQARRPLTRMDQERLESLFGAVVSPDGQMLAFRLERAPLPGVSPTENARNNYQRYEVWVARMDGGVAERVAGGEQGGFLWPVWSPDSQHLSMESVTGDGDGGLWVWERGTASLRKLVDQGLANQWLGPLWISNSEILYVKRGSDKPTPFGGALNAVREATNAWAKGLAGREASVSVLESGMTQAQPQDKLTVYDLRTSRQRDIMTGTCPNYNIQVSPRRRYVSCLRYLDKTQIATGGPFREGPVFLLELSVATVDGKTLIGTDAAKDVVPFSMRWSSDESELAVIARSREFAVAPLQIFAYRPATQTLTPLNTHGITPVVDYSRRQPKMFWTAGSELIVYAQPDSAESPRRDWWAVTAAGEPRNVTKTMQDVPASLVPERRGESFVGVAGGKLWRLNTVAGRAQEIPVQTRLPLTSIFWPFAVFSEFWDSSADVRTIVLSAQRTAVADYTGIQQRAVAVAGERGIETDLFTCDLASGMVTRLELPANATFLNYSAQRDTTVSTANDETGTHLWLHKSGSSPRTVLETNTFVREIAQPVWRRIQYRGMDGQDLTGWLQLPFGYEEGNRYPLVADVYSGRVFGNAPPPEGVYDRVGRGALLAAHGYAVLFPSMPQAAFGLMHDNFADMTKGVLPAVDAVIDLGIADPKKLAVIGHSDGGYSVFSLITQTKRFGAAVALAGPADLISFYGQFQGEARYDAFPQESALEWQRWAEGGQGALGSPPWKDAERYVRNSPIFYADRVETPILVIQGDMDVIPILQGEEFFMSMYRQGKRARFLRYWTSGHVISGANAVDMWEQIYNWFDGFLKPSSK